MQRRNLLTADYNSGVNRGKDNYTSLHPVYIHTCANYTFVQIRVCFIYFISLQIIDVATRFLGILLHNLAISSFLLYSPFDVSMKEGRKDMFYLTTHSTHFFYAYMASNIC